MSSNCRRRVASGLFLLYTFSRRPCFCVSCGKAGCSNTWQPCLKSKYLHDAISLCGRRNEGQTGTKISYLHIWHFPTTQFVYTPAENCLGEDQASNHGIGGNVEMICMVIGACPVWALRFFVRWRNLAFLSMET